jgi:hypothetical protein
VKKLHIVKCECFDREPVGVSKSRGSVSNSGPVREPMKEDGTESTGKGLSKKTCVKACNLDGVDLM